MNTMSIVLLALLLNTILGCITVYHMVEKVTLADLIFSSISGFFIFILEAFVEIMDTIERKCSKIVLFKMKK